MKMEELGKIHLFLFEFSLIALIFLLLALIGQGFKEEKKPQINE
jgi:hypothetical protein